MGGVLADRWGRRATLLTASLASVAATLALGTTGNSTAIVILATIYGFFNGLARPAFSAMMVDVLGDRQRVRGFNLNYWAINIGFTGAATAAGLLADSPRMTLFALDAAATAASALWIFSRVRETAPAPKFQTLSAAPMAPRGLRHVLADRPFMTLVALNLGMWTVISTLALMPVTMLHHGLRPAAFGSIIAVNGVMIIFGQLFVPRLLRGRSRTAVLAMSATLVGVGFGAVAFAPNVLLLCLTVVIWTLGEMTSSPTNSSLIADLSAPLMRGRYQGLASLSYSTGSFIAPVAGGFAIDHFGDSSVWLGGFVLGLLVALGHLIAGPGRERRVAALRAAPAPESADLTTDPARV